MEFRNSIGHNTLSLGFVIVSANLKVIGSLKMRSSIPLFCLLTVSLLDPKSPFHKVIFCSNIFFNIGEHVLNEQVEVMN